MRFSRTVNKSIDLQITPLIDVIFTLLVFLLISTSFDDRGGVDIDLPDSGNRTAESKKERVTVAVTRSNRILLDGKELELQKLAGILKRKQGRSILSSIVLQADKDVKHGFIVEVMDEIHRSGINKISIATELQTESDRPR